MTVVENMALALVDEAKRQNPDVWMDWSTDEEFEASEEECASYRIWSQHEPLDMLATARAALTALHDSFADPVVRAAIQVALDEKEA